VGTRGYIAPEVIGIYCPEDIATIADSSSLYTVAVDLWALGAIMFKLLTHENVFAEPLELARYVTARRPFPKALVSEKGASEACMSFLEQAMAHSPTSRPTSSQALAHEWLADLSNLVDSSEEFPDTM
jgi:serine/threonine protein kinase